MLLLNKNTKLESKEKLATPKHKSNNKQQEKERGTQENERVARRKE